LNDRSESLDVVRGIAIALVLACHYAGAPIGKFGVDLFFVLSGYLIGGILLDHQGSPGFFATFYWRRAFRILPLYWLLLGLTPAPLGLSLWWFISFTQNFGWTYDSFMKDGTLAVTWSLAIEEQFYLLLPGLIAILPPARLVPVLWTCVLAAPLWRYGMFHFHLAEWAYLMLPSRLDALMGGVLIACLTRGHFRVWWCMLALVPPATDFALGYFDPTFHMEPLSLIAATFALLLYGVVLAGPIQSATLRPLSWLGIGAYSIYLFHGPVRALTGSSFTALPVTLALAWLSWHYVEAPLMRFARAHWNYGQAILPVAALVRTENGSQPNPAPIDPAFAGNRQTRRHPNP
jgi:peptidoglycan/LPS O-acetylase OafA/YrhL